MQNLKKYINHKYNYFLDTGIGHNTFKRLKVSKCARIMKYHLSNNILNVIKAFHRCFRLTIKKLKADLKKFSRSEV